jgi:hypothetical protein
MQDNSGKTQYIGGKKCLWAARSYKDIYKTCKKGIDSLLSLLPLQNELVALNK